MESPVGVAPGLNFPGGKLFVKQLGLKKKVPFYFS